MTKKEVIINNIQEYLDSGMWHYESCYLGKEDLETIVEALKVESCEDCISRQEALDMCKQDGAYDYISAYDIANLPSVQPIRVKGEWINDCGELKCSECGAIFGELYEMHNRKADNYCPCCGADMKEGETDAVSD